MNNKILITIFLSIIAMFTILIFDSTVYAESFKESFSSTVYDDLYIKKLHSDGTGKYKKLSKITRNSDGHFVYCVQPWLELKEGEQYDLITSNQEDILGIPRTVWKKISLIAYYGYGYQNHTDKRWYGITQLMIWKAVDSSGHFYFTKTLNGVQDTTYDWMGNEIEQLVNNHYTIPKFNTTNINIHIGESLSLIDYNGILNNYNLNLSNDNANISIVNNTLNIIGMKHGDLTITLNKNFDSNFLDTTPILYNHVSAQKLISVGMPDPISTKLKVNVVGSKVNVEKLDSKTLSLVPRGDGTFKDAIYGVYNENDEKVSEVVINENGIGTSDYLPKLGKYYLKEEKSSIGYLKDETKYYFEINAENINPTIQVYENAIERKVEIYKVFADGATSILKAEPNITFEFYLKSNMKLYETATTDKNGRLSVTLPYGTYIVSQKNTTPNYEKVADFEITINENTENPLYKLISNAPISAKLKVIKVDKDTGNIINRASIKFKIFNVDKNEYVFQKITYPFVKNVCEFETDANGILITPYPLMPGTYRLEEVDQRIDGYLWNKESVEFHIGDNSELIKDDELGIIFEVKFANKEVKGSVTIDKIGEEFIINNGNYTYNKINLANVKIGLYAKENIYSANGKLIYKSGQLVKEGFTNKDGKLIFNNLYLGKYFIKESVTDNNHVLDDKEYDLELKYKDQYTENISYNITLINYYQKGTIDFTKTDLVDGKTILNTKIEIYTENDELVFSGITDKDGKIVISDLPVNTKFYIIESEPATGYIKSTEKIYFEIKKNGEIVKANMSNKPITGILEFTKIDVSTSETLPNTLIEIYNEKEELIFSGRTDDNGKIIIPNLKYGKYYIVEREAPEGYILNDEKMYFEILEDGKVVKATMTDEKVVVEVPNTDSNNNFLSISISLIVFATGVIIYEEIKKRENKKK